MPAVINGVGGPASFQRKLVSAFHFRGICVDLGPSGFSADSQACLVINGTRHLHMVLKARHGGARIVQRLGSPYWFNINQALTTFRRIRKWVGDQIMISTRRFIADRIVYQSYFVKKCWEREHGVVKWPSTVIYNGVDLSFFSPDGSKYASCADICIISVEGTQLLPAQNQAFKVAQELTRRGMNVELLVFGNLWADAAIKYDRYPFVNFIGPVANEELPFYYRGANAYVLNDIVNAGCPNSVIEALACGCPVIGYSLGVLPEILTQKAGRTVPAIGDPWKGEDPGNMPAMADAILDVFKNNRIFRKGARQLAEKRYDLEHMVDQYINVLFG